MKLTLMLFLLIAVQYRTAKAQQWEIISQDSKNKLEIKLAHGTPFYRIIRNKNKLLNWSELGLKIQDQPSFGSFEIYDTEETFNSDVWEPLWGKASRIKNEFKGLKTIFREKEAPHRILTISFRVYNDGIAFRYELPEQVTRDSIIVEGDNTSFNLAGDGIWWAFNGERKNLGPANLSEIHETMQTPFLFKNLQGQFIAILEAEIKDMAFFRLKKSYSENNGLSTLMSPSKIRLPDKTSWRVIMTTDNERQLAASNLIVNLNPPCKIEDTSWIKPGKSTWNWRGWGYKTSSGYEYRIDTESQKRFIDFAADNNIQYHLIDANWYGPEFDKSSDPTVVARSDFDVKEITAYAAQRNIGIFLYLNDVGAKKYGLERVLKQFHDWGAAGIKYGFMKGEGQEKVLHTSKVIALCAKYKLMLFFHDDPVPPSGDHRTWPHVMAREFGHAQADGKFSTYPDDAVNQPFINMLAGPLDMNYGWFDLNEAVDRLKVQESVPGTVAGELAKMAAIYSGFVCLPDVPEEYEKKPEMLDFINRLPVFFDEYKVLAGEIDAYISVARRSGKDWIVASYNDRDKRKINVILDFLQKGKQYIAYIYEDAEDSHFLNNKEVYKTRTIKVDAGDVIQVFLAPGGGQCLYIAMIDSKSQNVLPLN